MGRGAEQDRSVSISCWAPHYLHAYLCVCACAPAFFIILLYLQPLRVAFFFLFWSWFVEDRVVKAIVGHSLRWKRCVYFLVFLRNIYVETQLDLGLFISYDLNVQVSWLAWWNSCKRSLEDLGLHCKPTDWVLWSSMVHSLLLRGPR